MTHLIVCLLQRTVNSKDSKKNVSKSYEYDNMGRILRAVTNDLTTYYAYDDLGRKRARKLKVKTDIQPSRDFSMRAFRSIQDSR